MERTAQVRFPTVQDLLFSSRKYPHPLWAQLASYPIGTRVDFPGDKADGGVKQIPIIKYRDSIKGGTWAVSVWEQGAEEDIWTEEGWGDGRMEKTA
jgi:hypothetical protein